MSNYQFRGTGEPIVIGWGSIEYLSSDLVPGVCPDGTSDTINAVAHVYVVPSGTVYRNSSVRLSLPDKDVSGAVNTIIQDSGNFFNELIGTTGGEISAGKYAVVYDECQDGFFDDNVDFLFDPAFEVGSEAPPVPTAEVNNLKARAKDQADHYAQVGALTGALWWVSNWNDVFGAVTDPVNFLTWLTYTIGPNLAHLPDPFVEVNKLFLNNINHSLAIHIDPPDAGFKQLTPLSGRQIIDLQSSNPLLIAVANLGTVSSTQGALGEALLHSLERYQGAQAAGDGDWALIHARAVKEYASLLAAQLSQVNDALDQLSNALPNDTRPLDIVATNLESERARVESSSFSTEERQTLASLGLTVTQIDKLQSDLAIRSFGFTKAGLMNAIINAQNSNAAYSTALSNLAAAMTDIEQPLTGRNLIQPTDLFPKQAQDFHVHLVQPFNEVVDLAWHGQADAMNPLQQVEDPPQGRPRRRLVDLVRHRFPLARQLVAQAALRHGIDQSRSGHHH